MAIFSLRTKHTVNDCCDGHEYDPQNVVDLIHGFLDSKHAFVAVSKERNDLEHVYLSTFRKSDIFVVIGVEEGREIVPAQLVVSKSVAIISRIIIGLAKAVVHVVQI